MSGQELVPASNPVPSPAFVIIDAHQGWLARYVRAPNGSPRLTHDVDVGQSATFAAPSVEKFRANPPQHLSIIAKAIAAQAPTQEQPA